MGYCICNCAPLHLRPPLPLRLAPTTSRLMWVVMGRSGREGGMTAMLGA
jgi:hypothetical protein